MIEYSSQRTTIGKIQTRVIDKVIEVKGKELAATRVIRKYKRALLTCAGLDIVLVPLQVTLGSARPSYVGGAAA
jgi:hypothetical protein